MERLCALLAERLPTSSEGPVWAKIENWPGDVSPYGASIPLRFAGALHALVRSGQAADLAKVYPPHSDKVSDEQLLSVLMQTVAQQSDFILQHLESAPQTNEVRRASMLLPGFQMIAGQTGISEFVTSELGASAGLNLFWDHYRYEYGSHVWGEVDAPIILSPAVKGELPEFTELSVTQRAGCDLNPIDVHDHKEKGKLLSYLWPDQFERIEKTSHAIDFVSHQQERLEKSDAIKWLETRLQTQHQNAVHVVYHTIAWQYFPDEAQQRGEKLLEEAGSRATKDAPLAWLRLEADKKTPGAALTLTLWPTGETQEIARGDFHGRWIKFN